MLPLPLKLGLALGTLLALVVLVRLLPRKAPPLRARSPEVDDPLGQTVGEYRLTHVLGVGPRARVYRAVPLRPHSLGEAVAVKLMPCSPEERNRLAKTIRLAREVPHKGLARILDFGVQRERCYVVTELLEGQTLRPIIETGMSVGLVKDVLGQLSLALAHVHRKQIFHGDLRPENIKVGARGVVKIMDLGLAPAELELDPSEESVTEASWRGSGADRSTSKSGERVSSRGSGSALTDALRVAYLAPEQIQKQPCGPEVDQYALGLITYEMLTGSLPFPVEEPLAVMHWHLCTDLEPVSTRNPALNPAFDKILARMLEKQPENRYSSLEAAWLAIQAAL